MSPFWACTFNVLGYHRFLKILKKSFQKLSNFEKYQIFSGAVDNATQSGVAIKKLTRPFATVLAAKRAYREFVVMNLANHKNVNLKKLTKVIKILGDKAVKCVYPSTKCRPFYGCLFGNGIDGSRSRSGCANELGSGTGVIFVVSNVVWYKSLT
jgi:hypothetical protein